MLEKMALYSGIAGLSFIVLSLAYGLIAANWKSKAFGG